MDGFDPEEFVRQQVRCDEAMLPFVAVAKALRAAAISAGVNVDELLQVAVAQNSGGIGTLLDECLSTVRDVGGYPQRPTCAVQSKTL